MLNNLADISTVASSDLVWDYNEDGIDNLGDALLRHEEVSFVEIEDVIKGVVYSNRSEGEPSKDKYLIFEDRQIIYNDKIIGQLKLGVTTYYHEIRIQKSILFKMLSILTIIIVVIIVIIAISQIVTKPLKVLETVTEQIILGNYETDLDIHSNDEIGDLSIKFNIMRKNILYSKEKLKTLNESLETKVEFRTMELFGKNQDLEAALIELNATRDTLVRNSERILISQLLDNVAHEINTPIGNALMINSYIMKLNSGIKTKIDKNILSKSTLEEFLTESKKSLISVNDSIQGSINILEHFKELSKDKSCEQQRKFDLKTYIRKVIPSINREYSNVNLEIIIEGDESVEIVSYPTVYFELFTHLIIHSINYSFENHTKGGIKIKLEKSNDCLTIYYTDNGKTLKENLRLHLLEPFYQTLKGVDQKDFRLAIIRNLITLTLNGDITIEDTEEEMILKIKIPI